jgi:hypothetical protein
VIAKQERNYIMSTTFLEKVWNLEQFKEFVKAQPADKRYNFGDSWECPMAKFLKTKGATSRDEYALNGWEIPDNVHLALNPFDSKQWDMTYGALYERIKDLAS